MMPAVAEEAAGEMALPSAALEGAADSPAAAGSRAATAGGSRLRGDMGKVNFLPHTAPGKPKPLVDRHHQHSFVVPMESLKVGMARRLPPIDLSSTSALSARGTSKAHSTAFAQSILSRSTCRSARSCGVAVRPWAMPRQDTLPCRNSGKRHLSARDTKIRIFIRLAGKGGRLALWIYPDTLVGPQSKGPQNRFTEIWGHDAEERGPYAGKSGQDGDGRLTPFRALLAERQQQEQMQQQQQREFGHAAADNIGPEVVAEQAKNDMEVSPAFSMVQDVSRTFTLDSCCAGSSCEGEQLSLKELITAATGISVPQQKLMFGRAGLLDGHARAVCEYDIGHGATLLLSVRNMPGERREQMFLAGPGRAKEQQTVFDFETVQQFMQSKVGPNRGKDLAECLPDWQDTIKKPLPPAVECPQEPYFRRFSAVMKGQEQYNTSDSLRGRFREAHRSAQANAAGRHLSAGTAPLTAR